ncbi:hypothetical protein [Actinoplanes couchii]|uniref:YCII-related domain-containing protein n=1 Tax=Actinoplanes couchii TaxID=403638 RepID=A0ABQ3XDK7_9ACTN|nr:hypothetical protein [Actinoplanes couchii]MDR6317092.1 hypothetical protein [Actinoplanes couchii]GID56586.1 hypothetical protein Aco03nite_049900 [Actinoplanes couchii]
MWEFPSGRADGGHYLVLGLGIAGTSADLTPPENRDELIAFGPLLSDDGTKWLGTALLVRAPGSEAARDLLTRDSYADIEVHEWRFGGRR